LNLQTYIESGILELYVLNLLHEQERAEVQDMVSKYPELNDEIEAIEMALESYAQIHAVEPSFGLQERIERRILETSTTALSLTPIDENSDVQKWLRFVTDRFPEALHAENFCEPIGEQTGLTQVLVVSSVDIEDETHQEVYESFLILQGKCKCTVDGHSFYLEKGGYTQIPLLTNHKVEIVEGPVMAVVQYLSA
jgi:mannose-6-phosphate isomerase-like protein (cupin superfamily)